MMPKVSIIVPVYNVEKYLDRCVESLRNQTLQDIEIILVDDESPDACPQICDNYSKSDNRIKVVHKKNSGLGYARNSGLDIATGQYVGFIDSDDFVDLNMFETLYNKCIEKELDICYCSFDRVLSTGRFIKEKSNKKDELYLLSSAEIKKFSLNMVGIYPGEGYDIQYSMSVCRGVFRRKLIEDSHIRFISEREIASEDLLFHIHLLQKASRIGYIPSDFYHYFINSSSITNTYSKEFRDRIIRLGEDLKGILAYYYTEEEYKPHYSSALLGLFKSIICFEAKEKKSLWNQYKNIRNICRLQLWRDIYNIPQFNLYDKKNLIIASLLKYQISSALLILYKWGGIDEFHNKRKIGIISFISLIGYYAFAYWLPDSHLPLIGGVFKNIRAFFVKGIFKKCGKHVNINRKVYFRLGTSIEIGDYSGIGANSNIPDGTIIGRDVMIGPNLYVFGFNHATARTDVPMREQGQAERKQTIIEDDVWIGQDVTFTPGRYVKRGSIVGACTLLCKDFPEYSVIGGNPSRILKMRK